MKNRFSGLLALVLTCSMVAVSVPLLLATPVSADIGVNLYPTGNDSSSNFISSPSVTALWDSVDETTANDDADYIIGKAISTGNCYFTFAPPAIPSGVIITGITINYRDKSSSTLGPNNIASALKVGGNPYTIDTGDLGTSAWTNKFKLYSTNPKTGVAWTADDVNGVGDNALQAFGVYSTDLNPALWVTQVYAQVTYTPPAPVANFIASPTFGTAPLTVQFTDQSTNTPTSWAWDFKNDGTATSVAQNPSYTYTVPGTYTVKLTATNAWGSDDEVKTNCITVTAAPSTVSVYNLQPSWTAAGGGGVYSAYYGPNSEFYPAVSPGNTAVYLGRQAGIIKAGITIDTDGHYDDEGLFGFKPNCTINQFAATALTYDVVNQEGTNPVWMTIEIDTGVVDDRNDNTVYQHIPATNPAGWHTVDAGAGQWQMMDDNGNGIGTLMNLSNIVATYPSLNVVRAFLRLGMGDSYHGSGAGTIAWVDKATIATVTYDFELGSYTINASAGAGGSISPSGNVVVNRGADQAFSISAGSGYHVVAVVADSTQLGPVTSYTFHNVQEAHTITASFAVNPPVAPPWDANNDHVTDIGDVVVLGLHWNQTGTPGWIPQDLNNDGVIDIGDVVVLGLHWGATW